MQSLLYANHDIPIRMKTGKYPLSDSMVFSQIGSFDTYLEALFVYLACHINNYSCHILHIQTQFQIVCKLFSEHAFKSLE